MVTPSASSGGSEVANPLGSVASRVCSSRSFTPSRFSTVVRFHENATRSRQKQVVANISLAAGDVTLPQGRLEVGEPGIHPLLRAGALGARCGVVQGLGHRFSFAYAV